MLINMYSKCGKMEDAQRVFEALEHPDVVCWNALILGYADVGDGRMGVDLFLKMRCQGCAPDERTFVSVLRASIELVDKQEGDSKAASRKRGMELYLLASKSGFDSDIFVLDTLMDLYAKCGSMEEAREAFDCIEHPTVVSWTTLILGYADNGKSKLALELFGTMVREGCEADATSFVSALKACTSLATEEGSVTALQKGKKLHLLAIANGCIADIYVQGILVDMYAKCGSMKEARVVFDSIKHPNAVCWNALILGYASNGKANIAMDLFSLMRRRGCAPDSTTFVAAMKAVTDLSEKYLGNCKIVNPAFTGRGKELHMLTSQSGCLSDIYVRATLIDMYAKFGSMQEARVVFDSIKFPNAVCWNSLILGYTNNGKGEIALNLFSRMRGRGVAPDAFTFSAVLVACATLGALEPGKAFHAEIASCDLKENPVIATCLLDLYAKCGCLIEAEQVFHSHPTRDLVTWNALMAGYSCHGDSKAVFDLFDKLLNTTILQPDRITFNCVLTACSHAGLVDKGKDLFEAMSIKYGMKPGIDHCTCMIDIFCRSNKLDNAIALLRTMDFTANVVTWTTILGACRTWKNVELGKLAFESLVCLDEENAGGYVIMANIYGRKGMWADQARMQTMSMKLKVLRTPGESWWIDETGIFRTFNELGKYVNSKENASLAS